MYSGGPGGVFQHGTFNIFSQQAPNVGSIFQRGTSNIQGISPSGVFNDKQFTNSGITTRSNYSVTVMYTLMPSYTDRVHPAYRHFMFAIGHEMLKMDDELKQTYKTAWGRGEICKTVDEVRDKISSKTNIGAYADDARGNWQQYGECVIAGNMVQVNKYLAILCRDWKQHIEWEKYGKTEYPPVRFLTKMIRPLGVANRQDIDPLTTDGLIPGSNSRTGLGYGISSPNVHPVVVKGKADVFQYWDQTWIGCIPRQHRLGTNLYFGLRLVPVNQLELDSGKLPFTIGNKPEYINYDKEYVWELAPFTTPDNVRPDIGGDWPEEEQEKIDLKEKNLKRARFPDDENIIYPERKKWAATVLETLYIEDDAPKTLGTGDLKREVIYHGYWWGIGKYGHFSDKDQPYVQTQDRNTRSVVTCENGVFEIHLDNFIRHSNIID